MPKKIGGRIYAHQDYIKDFSNKYIREIEKALKVAKKTFGKFSWNTVRLKPDGFDSLEEVSFQYSPDFDTADEPEVVQTITCIRTGKSAWAVADLREHSGVIWHHKWMWVGPDYEGFDFEESKARSALWKPYVTKAEIYKIGRKYFWDTLRPRWERE